MTDAPPLLRLGSLLGWILPGGLALWLSGAIVMYVTLGTAAVTAQTVAFGIVLVLTLVGAVAALKVVAYSVAKAKAAGKNANIPFLTSQTFMAVSMGRMLSSVGAGVAAWYWLNLPARPLLLWVVGFYVAMLVLETTWLVRALRAKT